MAEQTSIESLEAYAASLSNASVRVNALAAQQHAYVNGAATADVATESGLVPTLAKQAVQGQAKITAALVEVASQLAGSMSYKNTAAGLQGTNPGGFFSVPVVGSNTAMVIYENVNNVAVEYARMSSAKAVDEIAEKTDAIEQASDPFNTFSVVDDNDNAALTVTREGKVLAPDASVGQLESFEESGLFKFALADENGNVAFGISSNGEVTIGGKSGSDTGQPGEPSSTDLWKELTIGTDDVIGHVGDSYTAAHYVVKDKAYLSQLSALSPFRHASFAVSGNDLLDMQYRIVNGIASTGETFERINARYVFITSLSNDNQFRVADQSYYAENVRRLVDTVRAFGAEPIITTEFPATSIEHALLAMVAKEMDCGFVDCSSYNREVGTLQLGPFHQGHPGSRSGGVFWLPLLEYIDRLPKPARAIKIYRRRSSHQVSSVADLLYKDRIDRVKRWKEIGVFHYSLNPEGKYDELNQLSYNGESFAFDANSDEYLRIANGQDVKFSDYCLLEITLPSGANSLQGVELIVNVSSANVYVRNMIDIPASMPGRIQGAGPDDATYLSKWDKPRGAWRNLGSYSSKIVFNKDALRTSMVGNTLVVLLAGGFTMNGIKVRYLGGEPLPVKAARPLSAPVGSGLLGQPLCGTTAQLGAWTLDGQPKIIKPIDLINAPRKPSSNLPVDGVTVITAEDTIAQTVTLPADEGRSRKYRVTVWARYFPKAFLRPEVYPGLDPAQVVDRGLFPAQPTITADSVDLRTLKCEMWTGTSYPSGGGAEFNDFVATQWRPVVFDYEAIPYATGNKLTFKLSCTDGEIQIGKVQVQEMQKWA